MGKTATKRNRHKGWKFSGAEHAACYAVEGTTSTACGMSFSDSINKTGHHLLVTCKRCVKALKRRERGL